MNFIEGLSPAIGDFRYVDNDLMITKFFTKQYCDYLISQFEKSGFTVDEDGNYDMLMHEIEGGSDLCFLYLDAVKKYIEPAILKNWTPAIKNRLWSGYPIPFCKKFSDTGQKSLKMHSDNSLLTLFVKLNSDYKGCNTIFPRQRWSMDDVAAGEMMIFPGSITHPHYTERLESGVKYSLIGRISILETREKSHDNIENLR